MKLHEEILENYHPDRPDSTGISRLVINGFIWLKGSFTQGRKGRNARKEALLDPVFYRQGRFSRTCIPKFQQALFLGTWRSLRPLRDKASSNQSTANNRGALNFIFHFSFCLAPHTPVFWLSAGGIPAFAYRLDRAPLHPHPVLPEHLSLLRLLQGIGRT